MQSRKSAFVNKATRLVLASVVAVLAAPVAAIADHSAVVRTTDSAELQWGPCPEFMPEGCGIAVLHGNPAEPNADVLFKVPGGAEIPAHSHTSAERMVLLSGEMQVRYDGHDQETLRPGTYAYGPPGLSHDATCTSDEACVLFIAFVEPVDATPTAP